VRRRLCTYLSASPQLVTLQPWGASMNATPDTDSKVQKAANRTGPETERSRHLASSKKKRVQRWRGPSRHGVVHTLLVRHQAKCVKSMRERERGGGQRTYTVDQLDIVVVVIVVVVASKYQKTKLHSSSCRRHAFTFGHMSSEIASTVRSTVT